MRHADLRRDVVATARRMNDLGINQGTSGNVSVRAGDGFLVTPSALPYDETTAADVVEMRLDGTLAEASANGRKPSTEWRIHRDVYVARPDVGAVVHCHSTHATALACLDRGIPAFHYMVAVAGGDSVRCAPYATFGTQALSDAVLAALVDRRACLLAHHGQVACGATLAKALALAVEVEALAAVYLRARAVAEPRTLSAAEMAEVLAAFADYGK
jgi:L-fuculose-phosphate aldolase